jgi:hypothetical protein
MCGQISARIWDEKERTGVGFEVLTVARLHFKGKGYPHDMLMQAQRAEVGSSNPFATSAI